MIRHASAGVLVRREDVVLVVIDVQERLLPHIAEGQGVVENIVRLARFARIMGLPVIITEQRKLGDTVDEIRAELPDIKPITKTEFSCLGCEEFLESLASQSRGTLPGIEAHICVTQTALEALPRYDVHAVTDAIASRSVRNWEVAIKRMLQSGVTITSTEMLIFELLRRADTEEFRAALELVKETPQRVSSDGDGQP